ncbi:MAG: hypothetical protein KKD39_02465 [Candidatus Altiarchaeota archaeon]|nr:hypothetical protein [Candidatus Altiarchaeota archaeon]
MKCDYFSFLNECDVPRKHGDNTATPTKKDLKVNNLETLASSPTCLQQKQQSGDICDILQNFKFHNVVVKKQLLSPRLPASSDNSYEGKDLESEAKRLPASMAWSSEDKQLISWFCSGLPNFPSDPFTLSQARHIVEPRKFYRALEKDISQGPGGPRARYGALQDDIKKLQTLFYL